MVPNHLFLLKKTLCEYLHVRFFTSKPQEKLQSNLKSKECVLFIHLLFWIYRFFCANLIDVPQWGHSSWLGSYVTGTDVDCHVCTGDCLPDGRVTCGGNCEFSIRTRFFPRRLPILAKIKRSIYNKAVANNAAAHANCPFKICTFLPSGILDGGFEFVKSAQIVVEKKHRVISAINKASKTIRAIAAAAQRIDIKNTYNAHLRERWQHTISKENNLLIGNRNLFFWNT